MPNRRTHIRDQFDGAADELGTNHLVATLGIATRGATLSAHHAATGHLADLLVADLEAGLPLCDHLPTPQRLAWSPGMVNVGCMFDLVAYTAITDKDAGCDLCGTQVRRLGGIDLKGVIAAAGPVAVLAHLCETCRTKRADAPLDLVDVRRRVIDLVAQRYQQRSADRQP
jgi:hypothetical protein